MKRSLLIIGMLTLTTSIFSQYRHGHDQSSERIGYAVTDSVRNGNKWYYLRKIDLTTGTYSDVITRLITGNDTLSTNPDLRNGVAAIAYDRKNRRLYFTPQFTDRLSYVDLRTLRTRTVTNNFTGLFPKADDQSNIITRMVIGDDNNGYALTNDGKHLIRFSTSGNQVRDLGSLRDHPSNGVMSVHTVCSSFGGDMIADNDDNLYLITSGNLVFKIMIRTRIAKYLGTVNGLPPAFVTSGAAVDTREEKIILVSSVDASDTYIFEPDRMVARRFRAYNSRFAADLAGGFILESRRRNNDHHKQGADIFVDNDEADDKIELYPNPVINNQFNIVVKSIEIGSYKVEVIDAKGQLTLTKQITTVGKSSSVSITLPPSTAKGVYIVRLTNKDGKSVYDQKILVQ